MYKIIFLVLAICIITSCGTSNQKIKGKNYIEGVEKGMSRTEVEKLIGKASREEDLGSVTDEKGRTEHYINLFYGANQSVSLVNDTVSGMDFNIERSTDRIQHTIDSAKALQ